MRDLRLGNWKRTLDTPGSLRLDSIAALGVYQLRLMDEDTSLTRQLDRVRFILAVKQGDVYGARGVFLGGLGALLGFVGAVLGCVSIIKQ